MTEFDPLSISNRMATLADMADAEMVRGWAKEVAQLEAELGEANRLKEIFNNAWIETAEQLRQTFKERDALTYENQILKTFCHAERQAVSEGRDYSLAVYMLRHLGVTKEADLLDLAWALSQDGSVSRGDWDGFKELWLNHVLINRKQEGGE